MNRFCWVVSFALLLSGCASLDSDYVVSDAGRPMVPVRGELTAAGQVKPGMTRQEVSDLMGQQIVIGYHQDPATAESQEKTLPLPYRTETFSVDNKNYIVDFYLTQIKNPDGIVAEDELTPFIFEGDSLFGKDWDAYFKLKQ